MEQDCLKFMQTLKKGDKVIYKNRFSTIGNVKTVDRTTQQQIVFNNGMKFWKKNGRLVGSAESFYNNRIEEATTEAIKKVYLKDEKEGLIDFLKGKNFDYYDLKTLKELKDIIDTYHKSNQK